LLATSNEPAYLLDTNIISSMQGSYAGVLVA
jgi:hypothetical protein